jgi:hypothetical protein
MTDQETGKLRTAYRDEIARAWKCPVFFALSSNIEDQEGRWLSLGLALDLTP